MPDETAAAPLPDSCTSPSSEHQRIADGEPPGASHSLHRGNFRLIVLLGLLDAFGPLGIDMYLPAFPRIEQDFGVQGGAMKLTLSLFVAGLAIGQLICGPISDRIGRRLPLIWGSVAFAVASVLCAFVQSIEMLILARFVMGLAGATGMVVARAVVRDTFNESESARVYSLLMLVIGVAPILSPSLGNWLMAFGDWQIIFWALGAFACVCAVGVLIDLPETHPPERRQRESLGSVVPQYASLALDRRFLVYASPASLSLGLVFTYVASAPSLFMQNFGLSPNAFSLLFAANAIGLIGAAQVNRWLARWYSTHTILRAAVTVNALSALLLPGLAWTGFGGTPAFLAAIFVCLSAVGLVMPNATAAVMAPYADRAGVASALLGMFQFTVGAIMGTAVGILHDGTAMPMALAMALCATLGCVILLCGEGSRDS